MTNPDQASLIAEARKWAARSFCDPTTRDLITGLADELESALADGGELIEALRPFSDACTALDNPMPDRMELLETSAAMVLTVGDLRRARAALDRIEELEGKG